jgi:hypothetical protein
MENLGDGQLRQVLHHYAKHSHQNGGYHHHQQSGMLY